MGESEPWFRAAFGPAYLQLYAHRDLAEARRLVGTLRAAGLLATGPVLDLGCGAGRHLVALLEGGVGAIGLDLSAPLLERARAEIAAAGSTPLLARGDLRWLPFASNSFGVALSLFTTFGYFESPAEDSLVLAEAWRVLRGGAPLVLDYLNASLVRGRPPGASERERGGFVFREERRLSADGRRVLKEITVRAAGTGCVVAHTEERVTLYSAAELAALVARAGLQVETLWGDYEGRAFEESRAPRLILVARKEESA